MLNIITTKEMQATGVKSYYRSEASSQVSVEKTIRVQYQKTLNLVTVKGSSIADHSSYKYDDLINILDTHFKKGNSLQLYFNYDFLDSSALTYLTTIVSILNEYHGRGKMVKVFWSCLSVADNMSNEGEKLKSLSSFEFHL
ncbi:MAG: SiaC family regulatory phosphoprotein [Cyclobacteriaceae bacterium]